jgi:hypothetical protein
MTVGLFSVPNFRVRIYPVTVKSVNTAKTESI